MGAESRHVGTTQPSKSKPPLSCCFAFLTAAILPMNSLPLESTTFFTTLPTPPAPPSPTNQVAEISSSPRSRRPPLPSHPTSPHQPPLPLPALHVVHRLPHLLLIRADQAGGAQCLHALQILHHTFLLDHPLCSQGQRDCYSGQ